MLHTLLKIKKPPHKWGLVVTIPKTGSSTRSGWLWFSLHLCRLLRSRFGLDLVSLFNLERAFALGTCDHSAKIGSSIENVRATIVTRTTFDPHRGLLWPKRTLNKNRALVLKSSV
jgi:hypothetical protein